MAAPFLKQHQIFKPFKVVFIKSKQLKATVYCDRRYHCIESWNLFAFFLCLYFKFCRECCIILREINNVKQFYFVCFFIISIFIQTKQDSRAGLKKSGSCLPLLARFSSKHLLLSLSSYQGFQSGHLYQQVSISNLLSFLG